MYKKLYYIALILILSCNDERKIEFGKQINIRHKLLNSNLDLGRVNPIFIIDSMLFIHSKGDSEGCFKLYSLSDYHEITSFGSIGRGPNEFYSPSPMIGNEQNNQVSIFDINGYKIVTFSVNRAYPNANIVPVCAKKINGGAKDMYPYFCMTKYNDSLTVGICSKDYGEMLGLLDSNLNIVQYFGNAPINEGLSGSFRFNGFVQAKKDKIVYVPIDYQYIACYTIKDLSPQKLWEDTYIKNDYSIVQGSVNFSSNARGRLNGLTLGNKYIYLYVNDNKKSDINSLSSENLNPNNVFIYDYAGKHIAKLSLDMRILRGCVSEDERTLYGIAYTPEPALVSFELPESY